MKARFTALALALLTLTVSAPVAVAETRAAPVAIAAAPPCDTLPAQPIVRAEPAPLPPLAAPTPHAPLPKQQAIVMTMIGALDARAARARMAGASVMALPSVRESLGAVYLEAMSVGVPALGTRGEGIADHIEHGTSGILVPPDDDEALFAELRALADDPERARRIGSEGRRRFEAGRYSWQANVDAYLALFAELRATHTT